MTERECAVPLIEQLRSVKPTDRVWIDESPTSGRNVPYGRMMHDAADEIERLQAARAAAPAPHPTLSPTHFCKDCGAFWRQCDDFTFNLRSEKACAACGNTPVGGQLIALSGVAKAARTLADEAQEYAMDFGLGCAAPLSYWEDLWSAFDPDPIEGAE